HDPLHRLPSFPTRRSSDLFRDRSRDLDRGRSRDMARDYVALTKPRIMSLLLLTGFCGMIVGARGWPGTGLAAAAMAGLALACGRSEEHTSELQSLAYFVCR